MNKHYGEIIEKVIRKNGYNVSELARTAKVTRRSIYNWFNQPKLKQQVILKIGDALQHDFSAEFPELFASRDFQRATGIRTNTETLNAEKGRANYWKDKYIDVLEEYNELLAKSVKADHRSLRQSL